MTIEIINGENNQVMEFFSSPPNTPETDAFFDHAISTKNKYPAYCAPFEGFCQKLERERDEAREESLEQAKLLGMSGERECRLIAERDEIQEKYDILAVENMLEVHKLCKERDEAREALRQIKASDRKTSGELRAMARIFLDSIK